MRVDRHLVLVLTELLDGVNHSRVALETQHHELLQEMVKSDLLGKRESKVLNPQGSVSFRRS